MGRIILYIMESKKCSKPGEVKLEKSNIAMENGRFVDDLAVEDVDVHSHVSLLEGNVGLR